MQFKAILALAFAIGAIASPTNAGLLESREALIEAIKDLTSRSEVIESVQGCKKLKVRDADAYYQTGC